LAIFVVVGASEIVPLYQEGQSSIAALALRSNREATLDTIPMIEIALPGEAVHWPSALFYFDRPVKLAQTRVALSELLKDRRSRNVILETRDIAPLSGTYNIQALAQYHSLTYGIIGRR
jgi:hypothetical protein